MSRFEGLVSKDYEMDPETEVLMANSRNLLDGMVILTANPKLRFDPDSLECESMWIKDLALLRNRWARISNFEYIKNGDTAKFLATYSDGTQKKRHVEGVESWITKKNSIPDCSEVVKPKSKPRVFEDVRHQKIFDIVWNAIAKGSGTDETKVAMNATLKIAKLI